MSNPTTIEEVLLAFENEMRKDSIGEEANPGYGLLDLDEALATIEQLVRKRVIGENDYQPNEKVQDLVNHNRLVRDGLRHDQRQALTQLLRGEE